MLSVRIYIDRVSSPGQTVNEGSHAGEAGAGKRQGEAGKPRGEAEGARARGSQDARVSVTVRAGPSAHVLGDLSTLLSCAY